jgi:hypothetical protein
MIFLNQNASNLNLQEFKERWAANKASSTVPLETPVLFRALIGAALQAETLEDAKGILSKATEVMDWVWPMEHQRMTLVEAEGLQIRVPRR